MKIAYFFAFSDDLGTREQVKSCIDSMPIILKWRYDMTNSFYLVSEESAQTIADQIRQKMNNNGRFIVTELGSNRWGWLTKASWYLMDHKDYMPGG